MLKASELASPSSALVNLATAFRHMGRGMEANNLSPSQFYELEESAMRGEIKAEDLADLVDYDYRNDQDGRGASVVLFEALIADATE